MNTPNTARSRGFTLTELLLAMGLFAVISVGLVALLSRAADFLTAGGSQTETLDALQTFAEAFDADISTLYCQPSSETGAPDVRLYSDHVGTDIDGDQKPDAQVQRLFFVRMIPNEATDPITRSAGADVKATEYVDHEGDLEESRTQKLRATGGLMEVFWMPVPESKADPAVMQMWRGYRAPPGGEESTLPSKAASDRGALPKDRGPVDAKDVKAIAHPVLAGVLYFGVDFWARQTTTWDAHTRIRDGGPLPTWDSTRGILTKSDGPDGFWFSKTLNPLDPMSIDDPTDDVFPRKIRVTVVVEELGRNARVGVLAKDLSADGRAIDVWDAKFVPAGETVQRHVKIGSEWIEIGDPSGTTLKILRRGARGTLAQAHSAGSVVHHGRTLVREYPVPTFRDTYRDELPSIAVK